MPVWVCPECGRRFGRRGQGHECAPAMSLEEYFSTGPPHERPIFEAVRSHLDGLGPLHVEPVSVGIFFKRASTFAELRPMQRWVALSFWLPRRVIHRTITRKVNEYSGRFWHTANLRVPDDYDDALREYLTETYLMSPE